jgi:hypothetical protein
MVQKLGVSQTGLCSLPSLEKRSARVPEYEPSLLKMQGRFFVPVMAGSPDLKEALTEAILAGLIR